MSALRDRSLMAAGALSAGHKLGRYEVLTKLASGGMAVVYVATAQGAAGFERLVALKVLHANLAHEEEFISMFLDEARLAARIRHPNVVATIDISDTIETGYYLVMEYVEGDHLGGLLSGAHKLGERIPVPIVLRLMVDALSGLGAAHDLRDDQGNPLNIVHRDVSPHNILVGRDGGARLTDFGVAKAEGRLTHTRDGQVKGKLAYMAPEQASSGATDSRSDLFSAGIIFWECVTGRRLFRAENTANTLVKLLSEPIAAPSAIDPSLAPLDPVLKKALDRDPAARFQTAEEFIEAIEWVAGRVGGVASPRAISKAVKKYAAEKLARERNSIEAAQRSIRGATGPDLFADGSDPSMLSSASQLSSPVSSPSSSSWSVSMRREKPSGVLTGLTAPRLFTRGRSGRPAAAEHGPPPIQVPPAAPPPLGAGPGFGAPAAAPEFGAAAAPGRGRTLLLTLLFAGVVAVGIGAWLALKGPIQPPEPSVQQLPPRPQSQPQPQPQPITPALQPHLEPEAQATAEPQPEDVGPTAPSSAAPPSAEQAEPVPQPKPVQRRAAQPRRSAPPRAVSRPTQADSEPPAQTTPTPAPVRDPQLLPNPYTR